MNIDVKIFFLLNNIAGQSVFLDAIFEFCARYLPYAGVAVFFGALAIKSYGAGRQAWTAAATAFGAGFIARYGVAELIRAGYHSPRPFMLYDTVQQLIPESGYSFPSGHTIFLFAFATVLWMFNRTWGRRFFILGSVVAVFRIVAGVHWPTDIVAGVILGVLTGYVIGRVARIKPPQQEEQIQPEEQVQLQ